MKRIYLTILLMLPLVLTSCLKSNLEDIEVFHDADITSIRDLYYYYNSGVSATGNQLFSEGSITRTEVTIDTEAATVTVGKAKPAAANIDQFDATKVIMLLNVSTAATIEPIEGSATLGVEADWTAGKVNKYRVTAADGTTKIWSITIQSYVTD